MHEPVEESPDDHQLLGELFVLFYDYFRALAGKLLGGRIKNHTLQPTALVNEIFIRLAEGDRIRFANHRHFRNLAPRALRNALVDYERKRRADKRGGDRLRFELDTMIAFSPALNTDLLDLDAALTGLANISSHQARIMELSYFGGLTQAEIAVELDCSLSSVEKDLRLARAWLRSWMTRGLEE